MATTATTTAPLLKQGDAYKFPVTLYLNGEKMTGSILPLLEVIEFTLGNLEPVPLDPTEIYSETLEAFLFPVTQEQTFALEEGRTEMDIRVQFLGGDVLGIRQKIKLKVMDATSEEVLDYA